MGDRYFDFIVARAKTELPGASENGLKQALFDVLTTFFDLSSVWLEEIPFAVDNTTNVYTITPVEKPPGQIIRLSAVMDSGRIGQPAVLILPNVITLRDTPNGAMTFVAQVIKSVVLPDEAKADPTPDVPSWIFQRWWQPIVYGVISKMMLQSGKSYSNTQLGAVKNSEFERECGNARIATLRRNTHGTNNWVYPQQFRSRGQRGGVSVGNAGTF